MLEEIKKEVKFYFHIKRACHQIKGNKVFTIKPIIMQQRNNYELNTQWGDEIVRNWN